MADICQTVGVSSRVKLGDNNAGVIGGGVDKLAVAYVHTGMADVIGTGVIEQDDIAGLRVSAVHMNAVELLIAGYTVKLISELTVGVVHETGAVKAGGRGLAAVNIGVTYILQSKISNLTAELGAAG